MLQLKSFTEDHDRPMMPRLLRRFSPSHFHCALGFATQTLAHMLDSLVRVSRRAGGKNFDPENVNKDRSERRNGREQVSRTQGYATSSSAVYRAPNRRDLSRAAQDTRL